MKDEQIIALYFQREEQAIRQTDLKYGAYFRVIAHNILRSLEDSEECVNDTYMKTWEAIPPTRPSSLKAFVGRITRNTALGRLEKDTALKRGGGETAVCIDELAECVSGGEDPAGLIERRELAKCLNSFLAGLETGKRIIFVRRYWYGYSVREIAQLCDLGESNVKVTLHRLRTQLKAHLEKEGIRV